MALKNPQPDMEHISWLRILRFGILIYGARFCVPVFVNLSLLLLCEAFIVSIFVMYVMFDLATK